MVSSQGRSGGLTLLWIHGVDVSVQDSNTWYIDAIIDEGGTIGHWQFIGFYG